MRWVKLEGESLEFYKKHRDQIDNVAKRVVKLMAAESGGNVCPHAIMATVWNCINHAIEHYYRSGQTAGIVFDKGLSVSIAPHPQGVALTFSRIVETQVLRQGPRVKPSIRTARAKKRDVAGMLSAAFRGRGVMAGSPSEVLISPSDLATLRKQVPEAVVEGEVFGVRYKLVPDGAPVQVR